MLGVNTATVTTVTTTNMPFLHGEDLLVQSASHNQQSPESTTRTRRQSIHTFDPSRCLFCEQNYSDQDRNMIHMRKAHGFFVPSPESLLLDESDFLRYLHHLIYSLHECIHCHSISTTAQGVLQHMKGKGHQMIDISDQDSEFRDFYKPYHVDHSSTSDESGADFSEEDESQASVPHPHLPAVRLESSSLDLGAGRRALRERDHLPHLRSPNVVLSETRILESEPVTATEEDLFQESTTSKALAKQERRQAAFAVQVAKLRSTDKLSLSHLSLPEQISMLAMQRKEINQARRTENRFEQHMARHGNLKSKERFVNDVPGGKSHKNRFFAQ